jgi:hypothetical protein
MCIDDFIDELEYSVSVEMTHYTMGHEEQKYVLKMLKELRNATSEKE